MAIIICTRGTILWLPHNNIIQCAAGPLSWDDCTACIALSSWPLPSGHSPIAAGRTSWPVLRRQDQGRTDVWSCGPVVVLLVRPWWSTLFSIVQNRLHKADRTIQRCTTLNLRTKTLSAALAYVVKDFSRTTKWKKKKIKNQFF